MKVTHPLPQLSTAALLIRDALRVCPACLYNICMFGNANASSDKLF